MRATYSNVKSAGHLTVNGVEFATATAHLADNAQVFVSDRMSKFKVFKHIAEIQFLYDIPEEEIDALLLLIKEDAAQSRLESEIE